MNTKFANLLAPAIALFCIVMADTSAMAQNNPYLSCRLLAADSADAVQFAGAAVVWSDSELQSIDQISGGDSVYECSRELRVHICRTFGGPLLDGGSIKEGALTGAIVFGIGGDPVSGAGLGAVGSIIGSTFGSTIKTAQCLQEIEQLTAITDRVSVDWPGTFNDYSQLDYITFLRVLDAARKQSKITDFEANRVLQFTDRVSTLIGN